MSRTTAQYASNCWERFHMQCSHSSWTIPTFVNLFHSLTGKRERVREPIWARVALICSISVLSFPCKAHLTATPSPNWLWSFSAWRGQGTDGGPIIESRISKALNTPGWYIITHKLDPWWPLPSPLGSVLQRGPERQTALNHKRECENQAQSAVTGPCLTDFIKISSSIHHIDQTARPSPIIRERNRVRREEDSDSTSTYNHLQIQRTHTHIHNITPSYFSDCSVITFRSTKFKNEC